MLFRQWNGQGICYFPAYITPANLTRWHTLLKQWGITRVRMNYDWLEGATTGLSYANSRVAALQAKSEGMHVTFGITQNSTNVTNANKDAFQDAIIEHAQWCEANSMDVCEIGNEIEYHNDGTTLTDAQAIAFITDTAQLVQAEFSGPVSYCPGHNEFIHDLWVTNGITGLDLITPNIYLQYNTSAEGNGLKELAMWRASFPNNMRVMEWGVDSVSLNHYSTNQEFIQKGVAQMLEQIHNLEIESAYYFCWNDHIGPFGILRGCNGAASETDLTSYRQPWNVIATDNGRNGRFWFKNFDYTTNPLVVSIGDTRAAVRNDNGYLNFSASGDAIGPIADVFRASTWSMFWKSNVRSIGSNGRIAEDGIGQQILCTGSGAVQIAQGGVTHTTANNYLLFNQWHDYAIVYDGSNLLYYRDGHLFDSDAMTTNSYQTAAPNCYFFNRAALNASYDGQVRDFMLYKGRALNQRDIIKLHNGIINDNTNRFIYWKMNDGSGSVVADSSGNNNNGVLIGATFSNKVFMTQRQSV